jgi:F-type H+-transporting ATPase subunit epsilon
MATLKLEIVTPEAVTYSENVDMVTLPGVQDYFLAVGEGFVEITGERVAILTDMAIKAGDIDETKAEEARKRAEARLQEKLSDEEIAGVNAALAHSLAQLKVKRRNRA